jgi:hypothetical protein
VVALTGIFFTVHLRLLADREADRVADSLALQATAVDGMIQS